MGYRCGENCWVPSSETFLLEEQNFLFPCRNRSEMRILRQWNYSSLVVRRKNDCLPFGDKDSKLLRIFPTLLLWFARVCQA